VLNDALLRRCRTVVGFSADTRCDGDALIGMLQRFRPGGEELEGLFESLPMGEALQQRLRQLYAVAGESSRPGGGHDAYFIVRQPPELEVERAEKLASAWLRAIASLAQQTDADDLSAQLDPLPQVRVLQGIAPKQSKADLQSFPLYRAIKQQAAELSNRLSADNAVADLLRPAYYFAACDWALRDYLLWPIYSDLTELDDPFLPYFELWRHGAKWRAFADDQIDIYLPHRRVPDGSP
jgi:hypothetical protein